MSDYTDLVTRTQETVVDAIKQAQEYTVSAVSTVSSTFADLVPDLPQNPLADTLPAPQEVVESVFGFTLAILEAQKDFALALAQAWTPKANASKN